MKNYISGVDRLTNTFCNFIKNGFYKDATYFFDTGLFFIINTNQFIECVCAMKTEAGYRYFIEEEINIPNFVETKSRYIFLNREILLNKCNALKKSIRYKNYRLASYIISRGCNIHFEDDYLLREVIYNSDMDGINYLLTTGEYNEYHILKNIIYAINCNRHNVANNLIETLFLYYILICQMDTNSLISFNFMIERDTFINTINMLKLKLIRRQLVLICNVTLQVDKSSNNSNYLFMLFKELFRIKVFSFFNGISNKFISYDNLKYRNISNRSSPKLNNKIKKVFKIYYDTALGDPQLSSIKIPGLIRLIYF